MGGASGQVRRRLYLDVQHSQIPAAMRDAREFRELVARQIQLLEPIERGNESGNVDSLLFWAAVPTAFRFEMRGGKHAGCCRVHQH